MQYKAALYMRLSRDDGGRESAGIESQRLLLRDYARTHGFSVIDEYVDDGYSGTRYDRPAFTRMLSDIEAGRIDLVLTKDLSRLGRNYIASGELTEVYFPEHKVRFIAINDGYDSALGADDMAPFRHVMNEMYARDISRKIRTALRAKILDGQYIGSFPPYGYRKCAEDKNRLEPDPVSAAVVKEIFALSAEGKTPSDIAEKLNRSGTPIPLDHRNLQEGKPSLHRLWRSSGICKILRNRTYLGHTIQGKTEKPSFRSQSSLPKRPTEWVVVENTHPPLVSEALFRAAERRKK